MGMAVRLAVRACVAFAAFGRERRARRADVRLFMRSLCAYRTCRSDVRNRAAVPIVRHACRTPMQIGVVGVAGL